MFELLSVLTGFAGFVAVLLLRLRLFGQKPADPVLRSVISSEARLILEAGPLEPCWTETIVSDGRYVYARSQCPNLLLMELDARAARGDFPIPRVYD